MTHSCYGEQEFEGGSLSKRVSARLVKVSDVFHACALGSCEVVTTRREQDRLVRKKREEYHKRSLCILIRHNVFCLLVIARHNAFVNSIRRDVV